MKIEFETISYLKCDLGTCQTCRHLMNENVDWLIISLLLNNTAIFFSCSVTGTGLIFLANFNLKRL